MRRSSLPITLNPVAPSVLLLDTSGAMKADKINALNEGLKGFKDDLAKDTLAARRVEVAIVTFDSADRGAPRCRHRIVAIHERAASIVIFRPGVIKSG